MASGSTRTTRQNRRHGSSVRSTHQAAATPITAHTAVTAAASRTVFQSSVTVRWRKRTGSSVPQPA